MLFALLLKEICKDVLLLCLHLVQGSGFKVHGSGGDFAAFFYWAMLESGILVMGHQS